MTVGATNQIVCVSNVDQQGNGASVLMQNGTGAAANILDGFSTAAGTLLTIPAGRTWVGTIAINGGVAVAAGGSATTGTVTISTAGSGVTPAAGNYLQLVCVAPASGAALDGTNAQQEIDCQFQVVSPAANSTTIVVAQSNMTNFAVSAIGNLL